ncbi:CoA transferase [Pseudonocardia spinosispora]|uniref:CoA transferase n=1 Tax=Pseudonocardia spinosispora TaxID=103441 RepID=UPI00040BCC0F|nr:CoA transferase [Pseudonocardia spinosispora]
MTAESWPGLLADAWRAVSGDAEMPARFSLNGPSPHAALPSALPVADTAVACVGAALLAAAQAGGHRAAAVDAAHLATAVRSEGRLRVDGAPVGPGFAPLSRFWDTADGWVRTHANYPWHRDALLTALGVTGDDDVAAAIAASTSADVENRVVEAGGIAVAMRTPEQWSVHPHGRVVATQPLITATRLAPGAPRGRRPGPLPASGVRVLDLTRVIAGPVCTRYLGALGADVLRLDPPHRPELPIHRYDGLPGKRSALLDATTPEGERHLHELLDGADVLVHGYRPGALSRFGLDGHALAERHPGLVVVSLSAWGSEGPWGDRRGFDSIVQVATGIAVRESPDGLRPGALPCQLLDHGTGYLCAAAALTALREQSVHGGTQLRELSLARTAHWLLGQPATSRPEGERSEGDWLTTLPGEDGDVTTVTPPGSLDGTPLAWPPLRIAYGADPGTWRPR